MFRGTHDCHRLECARPHPNPLSCSSTCMGARPMTNTRTSFLPSPLAPITLISLYWVSRVSKLFTPGHAFSLHPPRESGWVWCGGLPRP
uniref:Uncharacterized protein n=1 Tax=Mesocestoides corti TaxID=53468 RepID=A0A5K3FVU1_MESCO